MDKDRIEGAANQAKGALKEAAGKVTGDAQLAQTRGQPASFGEDAQGELYICDYGHGSILRILAAK